MVLFYSMLFSMDANVFLLICDSFCYAVVCSIFHLHQAGQLYGEMKRGWVQLSDTHWLQWWYTSSSYRTRGCCINWRSWQDTKYSENTKIYKQFCFSFLVRERMGVYEVLNNFSLTWHKKSQVWPNPGLILGLLLWNLTLQQLCYPDQSFSFRVQY